MKPRSGQIILFLALAIAALALCVVLITDIFLAARGKMRLQNTGDAAALAAARHQGATLNLLGDLNMVHLSTICDPTLDLDAKTNTLAAIKAMQSRLSLAGPLLAFHAANETAIAASPEGTESSPTLNRLLANRISYARSLNLVDYADMLETFRGRLHVYDDNAALLGMSIEMPDGSPIPSETAILLNRNFYSAVSGRSWTWFCRYFGSHSRATQWLRHPDIGEIPSATVSGSARSEFFDVAVEQRIVDFTNEARFSGCDPANELSYIANNCGYNISTADIVESGILTNDTRWLCYPWNCLRYSNDDDPFSSQWGRWREIDPADFPLNGQVRPEYDRAGAAATIYCEATLSNSDATRDRDFRWTAAAKSFGKLPDSRPVTEIFNGYIPLVAPVFSFTRLIPVGGARCPKGSPGNTSNEEWLRFLQALLSGATSGSGQYWNIYQMARSGGFKEGADWLASHDHEDVCISHGHGHEPEKGTSPAR